MKTKTINLYSLSELPNEAQEKAHNEWVSHNDYPFLEESMEEKLQDLLAENKITSEDSEVSYSLGYCQGDGAMFHGEFKWKKYTVFIRQFGRYYHSNSKVYEIHETKNLGIDIGDDYEPKVYASFETIYQKICKELEKFGYSCIESDDSFDTFQEICQENGYTFELSGKMNNL